MKQRGDPSRALLRLAAAQDDVVTREQATGLGLSRHSLARLVSSQRWQRLSPGLFLTHSATASWASLAWGGVLLGGDGSRLGFWAAGHTQGLVDEPPDLIHVLVPQDVIVRDRGCWTFVRERVGVRNARTAGSPPRALVADTVLDLCQESSVRQVEDWVTRAVQRRLTTPVHLQRALRTRSRHPHRLLLTELLADVAEGAESPLELRYLKHVERRHALPDGKRQRWSPDRHAVRDVLYPGYGIVVELDGRRGHEGEGRFRDMRRDNAALLNRLSTLRYGHADVYGQPCLVAWEVGQVLRMAGWTGPLRRCSACPRTSGKL